MNHSMARPAPPGSRALLARILDQHDLAAQIQALPPVVLSKLVDHVGLEDAGEIIALATTEQLARMFDEDLWKNDRPGQEERFDPARFATWLEVMMEAGESFVAERLSALPEDLLTLALHRHLLVLSTDALAAEMEAAGDDGEQLDKALSSCLYEELEDYQLIARSPDGWDTILAAVLALDREDHGLLSRLLDRCQHMSAEQIEDSGGLHEVLTSEEMLESDVAAEREDRRTESGYVAPATARSFLALARAGAEPAPEGHDAVTRAHFRTLVKESQRAGRKAAPPPGKATSTGLLQVLRDAEVMEIQVAPRLLPAAAEAPAGASDPLLIRAMRLLGEDFAGSFAERSEELAYLANVLVAGCSFERRRLRPIEALRAAIATCSLGLSLCLKEEPSARRRPARSAGDDDGAMVARAAAALKRRTADGLFRLAWHRLSEDVSTPAKAALTGHGGKLLDPGVKLALSGLADECPHLAGALAPRAAASARARGAGQRSRGAERPRSGAPNGDPCFLTTLADLDAARRFLEGER